MFEFRVVKERAQRTVRTHKREKEREHGRVGYVTAPSVELLPYLPVLQVLQAPIRARLSFWQVPNEKKKKKRNQASDTLSILSLSLLYVGKGLPPVAIGPLLRKRVLLSTFFSGLFQVSASLLLFSFWVSYTFLKKKYNISPCCYFWRLPIAISTWRPHFRLPSPFFSFF